MFGEYTSALRALEHGHGERAKRRLLARKYHTPLTDEEYERDLRAFCAEAVLKATDADLETWLAARAAARQDKATPRGQA